MPPKSLQHIVRVVFGPRQNCAFDYSYPTLGGTFFFLLGSLFSFLYGLRVELE